MTVGKETIAGPVRVVEGPRGLRSPFYVIPFDKGGTCLAPVSRDLLTQAAMEATDVFVFSHGWNDDFGTATRHYDAFISAYLHLREELWPNPKRDYRPLLAGVFWPSTPLDEAEPGRAEEMTRPTELDADLTRVERQTLAELAARPRLNPTETWRLAELLCTLLRSEDDEPHDGPDLPPEPGALIEAVRQRTNSTNRGDDAELAPGDLIRAATVLLMRDRAATVGVRGVGDLLLRLHAAPGRPGEPPRRIHVVGHSYGAKVVLAALSTPTAAALQVDSVLLLQPAVSAWCFATAGEVPGSPGPGAYAPARRRTRLPIVTTFSGRDRALGHAVPGPSAMLGSTGPLGTAVTTVEPVPPPVPWTFPAASELLAVRADEVIARHADVTSPETAWLLLSQVMS